MPEEERTEEQVGGEPAAEEEERWREVVRRTSMDGTQNFPPAVDEAPVARVLEGIDDFGEVLPARPISEEEEFQLRTQSLASRSDCSAGHIEDTQRELRELSLWKNKQTARLEALSQRLQQLLVLEKASEGETEVLVEAAIVEGKSRIERAKVKAKQLVKEAKAEGEEKKAVLTQQRVNCESRKEEAVEQLRQCRNRISYLTACNSTNFQFLSTD